MIDVLYFKQDDKALKNFSIFRENKKSRFILFEYLMEKLKSIKTSFLAKSLFLVIIERKVPAVLRENTQTMDEFLMMKDKKNPLVISLKTTDINFNYEPLKILINNNLENFISQESLDCVCENCKVIFVYICMKVTKKFSSQSEKTSFSYAILGEKNICHNFFSFFVLSQSIIHYCDIQNTLFNIIKCTVNIHSKPFYFHVSLI